MLGCRISRSKHDHAAPWGSGKGTEHAGDGREEHAILRRSVEGACDRNRPALRLARGLGGTTGPSDPSTPAEGGDGRHTLMLNTRSRAGLSPKDQLTDRRRKRALAANPASELPWACKAETPAAVCA